MSLPLLTILSPFVKYIGIQDSGRTELKNCKNSIKIHQGTDGSYTIHIINNDLARKLQMHYNTTEKYIGVTNDFRDEDDYTYERTRTLYGSGGGRYEGTDNEFYEIFVKVLNLKENLDVIKEYFNLDSEN